MKECTKQSLLLHSSCDQHAAGNHLVQLRGEKGEQRCHRGLLNGLLLKCGIRDVSGRALICCVCGDLAQDMSFDSTVGTPISIEDQGMDMNKGRSESKERGSSCKEPFSP